MHYVTRADERSVELRGVAAGPRPADVVGGLVAGMASGQPRIVTGIVMGPVAVAVERRDAAPGDVADGWQDVVEISARAVEDVVVAAGTYDAAPAARFAINPPGADWFRLRVHARGRDLEYDLVATGPREEYLLVAWPAPAAPPTVLSVGSSVAQRLEAGQARSGPRAARRPPRALAAPHWHESAVDAARRAQAHANLLRIGREQREQRERRERRER